MQESHRPTRRPETSQSHNPDGLPCRGEPQPPNAAAVSAPRTQGQADLAEALRTRGLSLNAFSESSGIGKSSLSEWLNGTKRPAETSRRRLDELLGVSPQAWDRRPVAKSTTALVVPEVPADVDAGSVVSMIESELAHVNERPDYLGDTVLDVLGREGWLAEHAPDCAERVALALESGAERFPSRAETYLEIVDRLRGDELPELPEVEP